MPQAQGQHLREHNHHKFVAEELAVVVVVVACKLYQVIQKTSEKLQFCHIVILLTRLLWHVSSLLRYIHWVSYLLRYVLLLHQWL